MAWDTDYQLEGLTMFGPMLNVWKWEVYQQDPGFQPLDYHRIHMKIDDNADLWDKLMGMFKTSGTMKYYKRLIMMHLNIDRPKQYCFYDAWLYSLEKNYRPSQYSYEPWPGATLGIAFDKTKVNVAAVTHLGKKGG